MLSVCIECTCICQCKPALMFANACIHSLFTVSWPSSTVHDLHVENPHGNVYMATLVVC